jgi:hypothetical protein
MPTWLVVVLVHGVDECERGDSNGQDHKCGEDGPDDLHGGVVGQLLGEGAGMGVVELGRKLRGKGGEI